MDAHFPETSIDSSEKQEGKLELYNIQIGEPFEF